MFVSPDVGPAVNEEDDEKKPVIKFIRSRERRARIQEAALRQLDLVLHDLHVGCGAVISVHIKPQEFNKQSENLPPHHYSYSQLPCQSG